MIGRRSIRIVAVAALAGWAGCETRPQGYSLTAPYPSAPWRLGPVEGEVITTGHYRIYTTSSRAGMRRRIGSFMEASRRHYCELTGLDPAGGPDAPAEVYLLDDRRQWEAVTRRITGPMAPQFLRIRQGGYSFAGVGVFWDEHPLVTYAVAAHEGLHQFCHRRLRDRLPTWAEEGLATSSEGFVLQGERVIFQPRSNAMRHGDLRESILAGRARTLERLAEMTAAENLHESTWHGAEYYGQVWALLRMIREDRQYRRGFERMIADVAAGRLQEALGYDDQQWLAICSSGSAYNRAVGPAAMAHYIDADTDRLARRYDAYCRRAVGLP